MRILHHHHHLHRSDREGEASGITLLEVIVSLMILAIIMVPLVMAFTSGLLTTNAAGKRLDNDGDMARITNAWTRDVVDVDPTGVYDTGLTGASSVTAAPCVDPSQTASTPLVSFQSDVAVSAGSVPRLSTWSIEGSGTSAKLVRTICLAGAPSSYDVLADSFGTVGTAAASLVHGPGGANTVFCTGRSCTIEIHGAYTFALTIGRRVPDLSVSSLANTAPAPPRITSLTPQNQALAVSWNPPELLVGQPSVDQYELQVLSSATGPVVQTVSSIDGNAVGVLVSSLTNGTPYWVQARAHNSVGWGAFSNVYGPGTPRPFPPGGPTVLTITRGDHQLSATWTAVAGATGYRIYARDPSGLERGPVDVSTASGTIGNLTNGIAYQLLISVTNADGEGARGPLSAAARPHGAMVDPLTVTARASGSKTVTVEFTLPNSSGDSWVNLNGNQLLGIRPALYSVNADGSLTYVSGAGYFDRFYATGAAGWNSPTSYTWQPTDTPGTPMADGTSYVIRLSIIGAGEEGISTSRSESARFDSVPGYAGAIRPPGVTPAGIPGKPGAVHQYSLPRDDQRFDVSFDQPAGDTATSVTLNGGKAVGYSARMDERTADAPNGTAWATSATPAPALLIPGDANSSCYWCAVAPVALPVQSYDRVVYDVGPVYGGKEYRLGMRIATQGEWPGAPTTWGPYSDMCQGDKDPAHPEYRQCVVAGVGLKDTATGVTLSRPANSAPQTLSISFRTPVNGGTVTRYNIVCDGGGAPTKTYNIIKTVAANTPVVESLSGLRDGRNYRCTVQLGNAAGFGGLTQSANQAMAYGECELVSSTDTYVDDEDGTTRGGAGDLNVARNGAWYEFGAQANRWALLKWNYADNCRNYTNIAMSSAAYLVDTSFNVYISDGGTTRTHRVYLITSAWNDSTNWGSRPSSGASPGAWSAQSGNSWRSLDVVTQARTQKASAAANNGWLIRDDGGDAYNLYALYASRENGNTSIRPYLKMRFYQDGQ
ncbi:fibronectin type III domain-containing protein [Aquihabitans sp. McL0605]|uniref:fibronectin type III domain-containing protein n=1 Tax=Aquihabitans sp. McL0605 TaxID=3415671 RepID=UPI003CE9BE15